MKQSDGYVWVEPEPGQGTTFRIYLPLTEAALPSRIAPVERLAATGTETVLVAEDEPMVRAMAVRALEQAGYMVLAVESGEAALRLFEEQGERIRLVITDVALAGVDELELGCRLAELRPGLPVLYMSGHPVDETARRGLHHGHDFIAKPFAPVALAEAVRGLLDSAGRAL